MVNIYVSDERKKFRLHRDLLCQRSEFFNSSFEGPFKEAAAQELALPEESVESFELFVGWLYGASVRSIPSEDDFLVYLELAILARNLCLEQLQNETMDKILGFYRLYPTKVTAEVIGFIYEKTSAGDPLRTLTIRCAAWPAASSRPNAVNPFDSNDLDLLAGGGEAAVDFATWLAKCHKCRIGSGARGLETMDPVSKSNCSYHTHNSTPACSDASG